MKYFILVLHISVSILLLSLIVLQAKGVGLGRAWGGMGGFYKSRRGVERIIFGSTVVISIIFLITSVLSLIIAS